MSRRTGHLSLEEAVARLLARGPVLVGLDFDGTLAPIVDHPDLATPAPGAVDLLSALVAAEGIEVVVVSGRSLADLRRRLGDVPGVTLIGEHGNDFEDRATDPTIAELAAKVGELARELEGAVVEVKPSSVAFHYRNLPDPDARAALERIKGWAAQTNGIRILEGKKVIELTTATGSKGDAIVELAGDAGVIYFGDDVTDETVFEALGTGDIGVKVGDGPTRANYRVKDVAGVLSILERMTLPFA